MRFKVGQEIVNVASGRWHSLDGKKQDGPKHLEIVTANGYTSDKFVLLKEYRYDSNGERSDYEERCFQPAVPQSEINELMKLINEPQTV